jgi:hypothetical protein
MIGLGLREPVFTLSPSSEIRTVASLSLSASMFNLLDGGV